MVIDRSALAANEARVGRVEEILVEGPSKNAWKQPAGGPVQLTGRTPSDHIVVFDGNFAFGGQTHVDSEKWKWGNTATEAATPQGRPDRLVFTFPLASERPLSR